MTAPALLTIASSPDRENEDAVVADPDRAVVVDGAGIPPEWRAGCHHAVAWYSGNLAAEFFTRLADPMITMAAALASAITAVRGRHEERCDLDRGSPSATVAAWRRTAGTLQYLVLCDASIILGLADGRVEEITDSRIEQVTAPLIKQFLAEPAPGGDPVERLLLARRRALAATRNRPDGFWCCQADPTAAGHSLQGERPINEVDGVIAASDGATRGYQLLGLHTVTEFAGQVLAQPTDLAPIGQAIRASETAKAEALRSKGIKVHDDLTIATTSFPAAGHDHRGLW